MIHSAETSAVLHSLLHFANAFIPQSHIKIFIDNTSALHAIPKELSSSADMSSTICDIHSFRKEKSLSLSFTYIQSRLNPADPLSRGTPGVPTCGVEAATDFQVLLPSSTTCQ